MVQKHRKDVVRGQLSANLTKPVTEAGFLLSFLVKYLLLNFIGRPDFIAYCYTDTQNVSFILNKCLLHTPTFAWTVRSQAVLENTAANLILLFLTGLYLLINILYKVLN